MSGPKKIKSTIESADFSLLSITPSFSPLAWAQNPTATVPPTGVLVERRIGYPAAIVIVDTTAPSGDVVINDNPSGGGSQIHYFKASNGTAAVAGTLYLTDAFGGIVGLSGPLGGVTDPDTTQTIGTGSIRSIILSFEPTAGVYPTVSMIEFGVTSASPRELVLEARHTPSSAWVQLVVTSATVSTLFFPEFVLATATTMSDIRLRHKGDFYTPSESATITVSASDPTSGVEAIQISRYPDMRDAADFPGSDAEGWVAFTDGLSVFDTSLLNPDRVWTLVRQQIANGDHFVAAITLSGYLFLVTTHSIYVLIPGGQITSTLTGFSDLFTTACVYRGQLYLGTSNGHVYKTLSGASLTQVNSTTSMNSIEWLASYQNDLYAGAGPDGSGNSIVWQFDGTSWTESDQFIDQYPTTAVSIGGYLYTGTTSNLAGDGKGNIWAYDGSAWQMSLPTATDTATNLAIGGGYLWFSDSNDVIHAGTLNTDGSIASWDIPPTPSDGSTVLDIYGSADGLYVWFLTATSPFVYVVASQTYVPVNPPLSYPEGLTGRYQQSNSADVENLAVNHGAVYSETVANVSFTDLDTELSPHSITGYYNATFTGFVKADYTEEYTFHLTCGANGGARVYVGGAASGLTWTGGTLIVNEWTNQTTLSGPVDLVAGQFVPIRVEAYNTSGTFPLLLEWWSDSQTREAIPTFDLTTNKAGAASTVIGLAGDLGGQYAFTAADGHVRYLDANFITGSSRLIYVNMRDQAGNITTATVSDDIRLSNAQTTASQGTPSGKIYQVAAGGSTGLEDTFISPSAGALLAPRRQVRTHGIYESIPLHISTLTRWDTIAAVVTLPATGTPPSGIEGGTEVDIYVRTADDQDTLLTTDWGAPFTISSIPPNTTTGVGISDSWSIAAQAGRFIQFKVDMVTASQNVTPIVGSIALTYLAANGSYFFSAPFSTGNYSAVVPAPTIFRGLLATNYLLNGGQITFGYTTEIDPTLGNFDFGSYNIITPNVVFELPAGATQIMFGIFVVSVDGSNPAVVDEYAVQLDVGPYDLKMMVGA